MGKPHTFVLKK